MGITHAAVATGTNAGTGEIHKAEWNADHVSTDPVSDTLGTPDTAFEFSTSSLTGLTAFGSPASEDANTTIPGHYYVRTASNSNPFWGGRYVGSLSAPFTVVTKVSDQAQQNYHTSALFVGDSGATNFDTLNHGFVSAGNDLAFHGSRWSQSTFGGNFANGGVATQSSFYLAIVVTTTSNVAYYYSLNGMIWTTLTSGRNPSLTLVTAGIATKSEETSTGCSAAFEFLRIWNSAKTLLK